MLAVSPARSSSNVSGGGDRDQFLLEDISFDDLFVGFDDGDVLPDLEIEPSDIFADFSFSSGEESGNTAAAAAGPEKTTCVENKNRSSKDSSEVEVVSARTKEKSLLSAGGGKGRKTSSASRAKVSQGKKKAKVDWSPELHRKFVQAVEQLGVDKAVPSRILELMGIDCLTRHNIASHLQKYRSHRKHLLAREAEAASWSHRRQMYTASHGGGTNMCMPPNWAAAPLIIGFPPPIHQQPFRPLHVWGHPTVEHPQLVPVWPRPPWARLRPPHAPPPPDPSYWHHPHYRPLTQGTPCFPPPPQMAAARFPAPPVPGIPPHPMFRPAPQHNVSPPPPSSKHTGIPQVQLDAQPSSESIDAAIGDVLAKPWQPLPLGLKPPSLESVMDELQKQGVAKVPPTCC